MPYRQTVVNTTNPEMPNIMPNVKSNLKSLKSRGAVDCIPAEEFHDDPVVALAWDYCKRCRGGEELVIAEFLEQLNDDAKKEEFLALVSMDEFVGHVVDYQVSSAVADA